MSFTIPPESVLASFPPGGSGRLIVTHQNRVQMTLEQVRCVESIVFFVLKDPSAGSLANAC